MEMLLTACFTVRIPAEAQVIIHMPPGTFLFACLCESTSEQTLSRICSRTKTIWCVAFHVSVRMRLTRNFAYRNVFMDCHICHLLTIHLKDVGLIQLFIAVGMTGVIAHVNSCYLGDVEGIVFSKILYVTKDRKGALLFSKNILNTT